MLEQIAALKSGSTLADGKKLSHGSTPMDGKKQKHGFTPVDGNHVKQEKKEKIL